MRSPGRNLTRVALAGMFVIPGLLATAGNGAHAAGPVTLTVAYDENGPASSDQILKWWTQIIPSIETAVPGVKIKLEPIVASEGDYYTKIDLMMRPPALPRI